MCELILFPNKFVVNELWPSNLCQVFVVNLVGGSLILNWSFMHTSASPQMPSSFSHRILVLLTDLCNSVFV